MDKVPFNRPARTGNELRYITEAVESGWISGDGAFTQRCQNLLERELGVPKALLTTSCTHALELSALLLEAGPEDEFIVPTFTFVSTANAFVMRGARPVFADIRPDTLNLDERGLEALITPRTRGIYVVHYAGVGCNMEAIGAIAARHGLAVVEDNAHGLFGQYQGQFLGTFGKMSTLSFHETKNFTCGEGGALLINDPALVERAEILREKGTDRSRFFRGQVDKYTWTDLGSSYLPSDLLAAFLLAQLEARHLVQGERRRTWERYAAELCSWARQQDVAMPQVPSDCDTTYHLFHLILPSAGAQRRLLAHMKAAGISAVFHYLPLHLSPMGRRFGGEPGQCPVAESAAERLVRLPLYNHMREEEQERVIEAVLEFRS